ncbi:MAG TPA: Hpt domain-containing protein [Hyphomonadaceae bacterium]|nr:Hpt domain-containing protein [Hyphomonadaceae bacterium]HPN05143.1 Hpt domain-containing protein [Hyphomonadaceae bacterium]
MPRQKPIEVITPPNTLKTKVGGALPALDQHAIAKAEAALEKMSDQFAEWIQEELARLLEAWAAYEQAPGTAAAKNELQRRSHDLKGLAPTYGYPLVGRICATLCKLTGDEHGDITAPDRLLKAHVDAVKAAILGKIKGADHPVGLALVAELEMQTKEIIAKQTADVAAPVPRA